MRTTLALAFAFALFSVHGQWIREAAVPIGDVPSLSIAGSMLWAGTDSTVFSTEDGSSWTSGSVLPEVPVFVDGLCLFNGHLFVGTGGGGVFTSGDNGVTWQAASQGLEGMGARNVMALCAYQGALYCGTVGSGVFRYNGIQWEPFGTLAGQLASNVTFLHAIGDTLWAGAGGNGYTWYTTAGASDWTPVLVAPVSGAVMFVTDILQLGGDLLAGSTYGVYRSADHGATWQPSGSVLGGAEAVELVQWGDTLFAARNTANTRLYASLDGGYTWELRETLSLVYAMAVHGDRLYTGRLDGLWFRSGTATGIERPGEADMPFTIYPNPAHDRVTLTFDGPARARFIVLDAQGRTVSSGALDVGQNDLSMAGAARGTYVLRVEAGETIAHSRLVLH